MTINEELKSKVYNLAVKSVELLLDHVTEYVPDYRSTKYEHQLRSPFYMTKLRSMSEVLFDDLVNAYINEIKQLSEFKDCLTILESDQIFSKQINQQLYLWGGALLLTCLNISTSYYRIQLDIQTKKECLMKILLFMNTLTWKHFFMMRK